MTPTHEAKAADQRPALSRRAAERFARLSPGERESLIVKCWMSHDARWFQAAAMEFGLEAAMRLNRTAVHEEGKVEVRRLMKLLKMHPPKSVEDYLLIQEAIIGILGPDLLSYRIENVNDHGFDIAIDECFAYEQVKRAGIAEQYECGILPRVTGWLDEMRLEYELQPAPAKCLKAQGQECRYTCTISRF